MSAFLQSGRSDHQESGEIRVRFRPEAAVKHLTRLRRDILAVANPCVAMPRDILIRHRECGLASSGR